MLQKIDYPNQSSRNPLLVVHGLYGSARNWGVVCRKLSAERPVHAVDNRNHGESDWSDTHGYLDLAHDLAEVIEAEFGKVDLLGHSMGGKAAMMLALHYPEKVGRLIVADIAPVTYSHEQNQNIAAMRRVDLATVENRNDAAEQLGDLDDGLKAFFLQSLDLKDRRWRLNLDALEANMPHVIGFPEVTGTYEGKTLFLSGANSDYVKPDYRARIKDLWPTV